MTQDKTKEILDMLNILNEYFLSIPDDMLSNIDPRDNESLEKGMVFIKEFNDNLLIFSDSSSKIEKQIKKYFSINLEERGLEKEDSNTQIFRVIEELDRKKSVTVQTPKTF